MGTYFRIYFISVVLYWHHGIREREMKEPPIVAAVPFCSDLAGISRGQMLRTFVMTPVQQLGNHRTGGH